MIKKIRPILKYTLLFVLAIILFLLSFMVLINKTVLDKNYIIKRLNKINYYEELVTDIKTEMSYYTNQSGFNDDILDDTFTKEDIEEIVNTYVSNLYLGKKTTVDSANFEEKLNNKITAYFTQENFKIDNQESVDKFVSEMAKIYRDKIKVIKYFENLSPKLVKLEKYVNAAIKVLTIALVILLIIDIIFFKTKDLGIILYTNSFLIVAMIIYVKNRIAISNMFVYNKLLSNLIIDVINNLIHKAIIIAIIYFILATIKGLLEKKMEK